MESTSERPGTLESVIIDVVIDEQGDVARFAIDTPKVYPTLNRFYPEVSSVEHIHWGVGLDLCKKSFIPMARTRLSNGRVAFFCKECGLRFILEDVPMESDEIKEHFQKRGLL